MRFVLVFLLMLISFANGLQAETVQIGVEVEVVKADKICAKAIKVLTTSRTPEPMTLEAAQAFVSIEGKQSTAKCLEVIFSDLSSPTNGYRVHEVSSR